MTRDRIQEIVNEFCDNSPLNYLGAKGVGDEDVLANNYAKHNLYHRGITADMLGADADSGLMGMRFFQRPIFAIARADDPGFKEIRRPEVVGPHHLLPEDWLPGAKSVISFFCRMNARRLRRTKKTPSSRRLSGFTRGLTARGFARARRLIRDLLVEEGYRAVAPYCDDRYIMQVNKNAAPGTGMSRRILRMVGAPRRRRDRPRHVRDVDEFYSKPAAPGDWSASSPTGKQRPTSATTTIGLILQQLRRVAAQMPARAHYSDRHGKDHEKCGAFIRKVCEKYAPRYGCGNASPASRANTSQCGRKANI